MIEKDQETRIPFSDVASRLNEGLEQVDPERVAALVQLQRVRAIKGTSLERERQRLAQKLGTSHPRVAALSRQIDANREFERDLVFIVNRAKTPVVQADPNAWTLHGYVRDAALNGIQKLKIALYDDKKRWVEELGHACTDAHGYFRLTTAGGAPHAEEVPTAVEEVQEKLRRAAAAKPSRRLYIHITNADNAMLYVDNDPVTPKLGEVVYREIILDGDAEGCPPPGGEDPSKPAPAGGGKNTEAPKQGRYLGNREKKEVHDLSKATPACQIDEIAAAQREHFSSQKQAVAAGYRLCAYCFGKDQSKR